VEQVSIEPIQLTVFRKYGKRLENDNKRRVLLVWNNKKGPGFPEPL
jgi:hypothetical protein